MSESDSRILMSNGLIPDDFLESIEEMDKDHSANDE